MDTQPDPVEDGLLPKAVSLRLMVCLLGVVVIGLLLAGFGFVALVAGGSFAGGALFFLGLLGVGISVVVGLAALFTDRMRRRRDWTIVRALRESPRSAVVLKRWLAPWQYWRWR